MQNTSALYKTIVSGEHWFESKISIAGNSLESDNIISLSTSRSGMNAKKPTVGGAISSTLELTIIKPQFTIPRMAEIDVFFRACNDTQQSEWLPAGVYFIDTRKEIVGKAGTLTLSISAFDAIMKGEQDYPDTSHAWPYLDKNVVAEIATTIGVTVDSRTNGFLTSGFQIGLPSSYTMREVLQNIAASYGGNFIITNENKLLFVPLYGLAPDISGNYLADENGNALVFGNEGWCVLV